ncbi:unnamed protein product [Paramecium primaurelia]|uniref:Uncharacterized protein n=1 Tax=Paramecium primaurelia TaxID=5886 RepID=A0A8S1PCM7_PARPR|nr:unnamed protein product [Paramecium primaurelia]
MSQPISQSTTNATNTTNTTNTTNATNATNATNTTNATNSSQSKCRPTNKYINLEDSLNWKVNMEDHSFNIYNQYQYDGDIDMQELYQFDLAEEQIANTQESDE